MEGCLRIQQRLPWGYSRWCVVDSVNQRFVYHKNASKNGRSTAVDLTTAEVNGVAVGSFEFCIMFTPNRKIFICDSAENRAEWLDAIRAAAGGGGSKMERPSLEQVAAPAPAPATEAEPTADEADVDDDDSDDVVLEPGANIHGYTMVKELGKGSFARVVLATAEDGEPVAIKVFNKAALENQRDIKRVGRKMVVSTALQKVRVEIAIMKKLHHANIVSLHEVIDDEEGRALYMVLDYVANGQVMDWHGPTKTFRSPDGGPLSLDVCRNHFRDCVKGLSYLHRNRIVHRDLKPDNILVAEDGSCKIADFGVAHIFDENRGSSEATTLDDTGRVRAGSEWVNASDNGTLRDTEGTYHFLSPEALSGAAFSGYCADVWALGVTFYALAFGKLPFWGNGIPELMDAIETQELTFPDGADEGVVDLIRSMLNRDPEQRATLAAVKTHPWMNEGYDNDQLANMVEPEDVSVSEAEVESAVTSVRGVALVMATQRIGKQWKSKAMRHASGVDASDVEVVVPAADDVVNA